MLHVDAVHFPHHPLFKASAISFLRREGGFSHDVMGEMNTRRVLDPFKCPDTTPMGRPLDLSARERFTRVKKVSGARRRECLTRSPFTIETDQITGRPPRPTGVDPRASLAWGEDACNVMNADVG